MIDFKKESLLRRIEQHKQKITEMQRADKPDSWRICIEQRWLANVEKQLAELGR